MKYSLMMFSPAPTPDPTVLVLNNASYCVDKHRYSVASKCVAFGVTVQNWS